MNSYQKLKKQNAELIRMNDLLLKSIEFKDDLTQSELEELIAVRLGYRLTRLMKNDLLYGTGVGEPIGIIPVV